MKVVGLTGGIGMGKSACADLLRTRGIPFIDTDELARTLVQPGQPALLEITEAFGASMLTPAGQLDRKSLARVVFADAEARKQLEAILHPKIRAAWKEQVATLRHSGTARLCVIVIPLLFETNAQTDLEEIICVACSPATQRERLSGRGWSPTQIEQRLQAQWPVEKKMALSNYVIWTEGSMQVHEAQLEKVLNHLALSDAASY